MLGIVTIHKVYTPSSPISIMANCTAFYFTICVLVLCVTSIHCNPIKCQTETVIDVNFPHNLTQAITQALPNIGGSQNKTVALLENMTTTLYAGLERQDQQLQSLTLTMASVASLLQSQLSLLSERLPPPAAKGLDMSDNNITPVPQDSQGTTTPASQGSTRPPRDCYEILAAGETNSGPYVITPQTEENLPPFSFTVYCDMETDGGGWTVFQRRFNGGVDFYKAWQDYTQGFGSPDGEYWLGLEQIYKLARYGTWTLRVDIEAFDYVKKYAKYESFYLGDAESYYTLNIGSYSGNAGDNLRFHKNQPFSTRDTDHDGVGGGDCAQAWKGGWWYHDGGFNCHDSNLNGLYLRSTRSYKGMVWDGDISQKKSEMKIRRNPGP